MEGGTFVVIILSVIVLNRHCQNGGRGSSTERLCRGAFGEV
jgi:hypothetical protein